ncbi:type IV pilus modification PilV family protein [Persephonella sp.]
MVQIVKLNKKGYTLVETLVAMLIFSFVLIFMLQGFTLAYRINFEKLIKTEAVKLAQNEIEVLRNMDPSKIYDINNDGTFEDPSNRTDCSTCTTNPTVPECAVTRQVRNVNVKFGKKVIVVQPDPDAEIYRVTVTICTNYKKFNSDDKISHTISTVIAKDL